MSKFGAMTMCGPLARVIVRTPPAALATADPALWHYGAAFDLKRARAEHQEFVTRLRASGAEVIVLTPEADTLPDSMYTHDASLVTTQGAILTRMGKALRAPEPDLHAELYRELGVPILGRIEPPGTLEGGDVLWIDERTVVVGRGYRTNLSGITQLASLLRTQGVSVSSCDLPYAGGPQACMHLLSLISPVAPDLALVHLSASPVSLIELLHERGIKIIAAPEREYYASGAISANVLALAAGNCLMVDGYPETRAALEAAGCQVEVFQGQELCVKGEGGPTCLTRPLLRR